MHVSGNELINPFKVLEACGVVHGFHVADLGCGALGHFVFPAAQMVGGEGKVYAVDVMKDVLRSIERIQRQEQFFNVYPVWSDVEVVGATRIPEASLDLAIIANNLFLSKSREHMITEALRLLKVGGRILLIEWKREKTPIGPDVEHRLAEHDARAYLKREELLYKGRFDAGEYHYALVAEKQ